MRRPRLRYIYSAANKDLRVILKVSKWLVYYQVYYEEIMTANHRSDDTSVSITSTTSMRISLSVHSSTVPRIQIIS